MDYALRIIRITNSIAFFLFYVASESSSRNFKVNDVLGRELRVFSRRRSVNSNILYHGNYGTAETDQRG